MTPVKENHSTPLWDSPEAQYPRVRVRESTIQRLKDTSSRNRSKRSDKSAESTLKGKLQELIIADWFSVIRTELSNYLLKNKLGSIKGITYDYPSSKHEDEGKDMVIILEIENSSMGEIKIPIITEVKSSNNAKCKDDETNLGLYRKIDQIRSSVNIKKYVHSRYYIGASYCVFAPFIEITRKQPFLDKVECETHYDILNFPDHYWYISQNVAEDGIGFSEIMALSSDLVNRFDEPGFKDAKNSGYLNFDQNKAKWRIKKMAEYVGKNILKAVDRFKNNIKRLVPDSSISPDQASTVETKVKTELRSSITSYINPINETDAKIVEGYRNKYLSRQFTKLLTHPVLAPELKKFNKSYREHVMTSISLIETVRGNSFRVVNQKIDVHLVNAKQALSISIVTNYDSKYLIYETMLISSDCIIGYFYQRYVEDDDINTNLKFVISDNYIKLNRLDD